MKWSASLAIPAEGIPLDGGTIHSGLGAQCSMAALEGSYPASIVVILPSVISRTVSAKVKTG